MNNQILVLTLLFCLGLTGIKAQDEKTGDPEAAFFHADSIISQAYQENKRWESFFKGENVLTGMYLLTAGEQDKQRPHDTDEVYYVLKGKALFEAGGRETSVSQGSILFVKANVAHRFKDIEEDLQLLVFFDQ